MAERPYDFRRPSSVPAELEGVIAAWVSALESSLKETWVELLPRANPTAKETSSVSRFELSREMTARHLSLRVAVGQLGGQAALILDRPDALAIVAAMTGIESETPPEDRELSQLEFSLLQLAFDAANAALRISCPFGEPPSFSSLGFDSRSDAIRFRSGSDRFLRISFRLEGIAGGVELSWIFSQGATDLLTALAKSSPGRSKDEGELEPLLMEVPLDISVKLGSTDIHITELVDLKPGDLLVLRQRVSEPLLGTIAGDAKFVGWPGRIGNRQAFQIEDLAE